MKTLKDGSPVLVIGMGKVGSLVGILLNKRFTVTGLDKNPPHYDFKLPFDILKGDCADLTFLEKTVTNYEAVVSCMPFYLNLPIANICHKNSIHYFDLTEDVPTTQAIREMAATATSVLAPQCGLAPGFIGIVGADLCKRFDKIRDIELRVGALPQFPNGQLGYSFTWSPAGVINEYINDCEVIHNGTKKMVPALDGLEKIYIGGEEFEAFSTSGGLGTMCETFEGKVDTLNYKTMRYPGHCALMKFLIYELIMKNNRQQLEQILTNSKPPVQEDVVYVYAVVEGWKNEKIKREEYYRAFKPITIDGEKWRAISWTTAAAIAATVEMVADGKLSNIGFIKQEEINFEDFLNTSNGSYYKYD
ncbi:L-lysine dehydrogenase [Lacihabitans sp. LS3-19]|uniref:saccharopine dehydrogenase family protein n=1 Tax=Lacihabitans sp. LS3-19 TaxID=2487335 RepID=UPI0020CCB114|nr:saccharopine dehydrogenase C-terminal domain-containing protein [Lacihabitans sp. LS3-19]MCP9768246.1 L-lysine dehydrogenase [Lacihabitans sp. LS3-19]